MYGTSSSYQLRALKVKIRISCSSPLLILWQVQAVTGFNSTGDLEDTGEGEFTAP